jgi:hypothetical protein
MTTIDLYRKHKAGEVSREKFLYEVRRDNNLPFITNLTSYDDAVKILKNKGIVTEAPIDEDFNFVKKMKDFAGEKGFTFSARRPTDEEDQIARDYMRSQGKELGSIGVDRITGNINVMEPNGDFRAILSSDGEELSAYEMDIHENLNESETKEAKADEAVKAEVKPKAPTTKKLKTLHLDVAHPYEYRLGLQQELNTLGEYTDEAFSKAKIKVLKNLAKDANFYTTLLNAKTSPYTFKKTETNEKGMQARSDGYMKKEAKKDEKANVKDNLGKKEEGTVKPKGVKVMPDKGVTGAQKTIKEGSFMGGVDLGSSFDKMKQDIIGNKEDFELADENAFEDLMKKYDFYAEMSDDDRKWDAQQTMNNQLKQLAKKIGVEKAIELFNQKAPTDRKVNATFFGINEDKHASIKEKLKKGLKELLTAGDIAAAKTTGKPINVAKSNTTDIQSLQRAKANFTIYE